MQHHTMVLNFVLCGNRKEKTREKKGKKKTRRNEKMRGKKKGKRNFFRQPEYLGVGNGGKKIKKKTRSCDDQKKIAHVKGCK